MNHDDLAPSAPGAGDGTRGGLNVTVPVSARIWNYWMGGKDYYQVDKRAGDDFAALYPGIWDMARASRLFLGRVVRYLAGQAGVRQFLDIGTGLPSNENTHEVAERAAAGSRVVYVDNDPLVMTHARALLTGVTMESTDYIDGDLNDPGTIIAAAREKLDFTCPVAVMLMGVLGHIGDPDSDGDRLALSVVSSLKAALPAGGYLVVRDATNTVPAHVQALRAYAHTGADPYRLRSPEQITRFFDGLEPVEPGVVPIQRWRPDQESSRFPADINMWGGVAVKRLSPAGPARPALRPGAGQAPKVPWRPAPATNRAAPSLASLASAPSPWANSDASAAPSSRPSASSTDARSLRRQACGNTASRAARSWAAARACPAGTTRLASPIAAASAASTGRPVRIMSIARLVPIRRGSRTVPPSMRGTPQRRQKTPNTAVSSATRRSHHKASSRPPATAYPDTAAITGLERRSRLMPIGPSPSAATRLPRSVPSAVRSAPEQKTPPAPCSTATAASGSASNARNAAASRAAVGPSTALRRAGRCRKTVVTAPDRSTWTA